MGALGDAGRESLRELASRRGLLTGAEVNTRQLEEPDFVRALERYAGCVVAGNQMKWKPTEPARGGFTLDAADRIVSFAEERGMKVRGHTLVWHHESQLPDWIRDGNYPKDEWRAILKEHIRGVVGRYRGRVFAWDVVNEGLAEKGWLREDSPWFRALGEEYLDLAFRLAHEADPGCLLFYNDYEMDAVNDKSDRCVRLVKGMIERGVPVHGVGLQYHVRMEAAPERGSVLENMKRLGDLGLVVHVTEMDVWIRGAAGRDPAPHELARQAEVYRDAFQAALESGSCRAFLTWGLTDRHSWVPGFTKKEYGSALMLDADYRPKPAHEEVCRLLAGR